MLVLRLNAFDLLPQVISQYVRFGPISLRADYAHDLAPVGGIWTR